MYIYIYIYIYTSLERPHGQVRGGGDEQVSSWRHICNIISIINNNNNTSISSIIINSINIITNHSKALWGAENDNNHNANNDSNHDNNDNNSIEYMYIYIYTLDLITAKRPRR